MKRLLTMIGIVAALGCSSDESIDVTAVDTTVGEGVAVDLGTADFRPRRRMDIDQLNASIRRVTGGIGWERGTTDQFERFSDTLGRPDWIENTREDLAPSTLFLKFLDDAARDVCNDLMRREVDEPATRVFFMHVEPDADITADQAASDRNLVHLLQRFHGRFVDASSQQLDPWRDLLSRANDAVDDPRDAWEVVCVALIDHPDFYTY